MPTPAVSTSILQEILTNAASEVLETMFFALVDPGPDVAPAGTELVDLRVKFQGHPSGVLRVHASVAALRPMTASFLGMDQENITSEDLDSVSGELANMLCGATLTRLELDSEFDLGSPERIPADDAPLENDCRVRCAFYVDGEYVAIEMELYDDT